MIYEIGELRGSQEVVRTEHSDAVEEIYYFTPSVSVKQEVVATLTTARLTVVVFVN